MINIGLTGWGDHYHLYPPHIKPKDKLPEYSSHFPVVELDASFYAIQPTHHMEKWIKAVPESFRFVMKAYQGMTGHLRGEIPFSSKREMFTAFTKSLAPLRDSGKLAAVLFQFPPWFDCCRENVQYLRYVKQLMGETPLALEFRNHTWFSEQNRKKTLSFMKTEGWIHSVVDEPQVGEKSAPCVPVVTNENVTIVRLHGRNRYGWNKPKDRETNWRDVRYLYNYNQTELRALRTMVQKLNETCEAVIVLFNNNSGGDAAANAKTFQEMLQIHYDDLAPRQMNLF